LMTLAEAKAGENRTFTVQASLTIVTYDRKNSFIVQATFIDIIKAPFPPSLTTTQSGPRSGPWACSIKRFTAVIVVI
jgi:hypothetical protein